MDICIGDICVSRHILVVYGRVFSLHSAHSRLHVGFCSCGARVTIGN